MIIDYPRATLNGSSINVICAGNSHVAGEGSSSTANRWTDVMMRSFTGISMVNVGIGGQSIQSMIDNAATQVDNRLVAGKINVLFAQEFGNEMAANGRDANAAHAKWVTYCNGRKAAAASAGKKLFIVTVGLHPTGAAATYPETLARIASVQQANALIRENYREYCDLFMDLGALEPFAGLFAGGVYTEAAFAATGMYNRSDGVPLDRVHMGDDGHARTGWLAVQAFRRIRAI